MAGDRGERCPVALELRGIAKRFGELEALRGVTVSVRRGTVHALLGENGAGKSTLLRIAYGLLRADAGEVCVNGRALHPLSPADALAAGIGMVHQHFTLVPAMTVAENVALGGRGVYDRTRVRRRLRELTRETGFALDPDARVEALDVGAQQRVEIAKALLRDVHVLVLDEPTAVLAPHEVDELLDWLRRFAAGGGSVVLITHKLRDALSAADDVTVLRRGAVVWRGGGSAASATALADAITGGGGSDDPAAETDAPRHAGTGEEREGGVSSGAESGVPRNGAVPVFSCEDVWARDALGAARLRGATLSVYAGEIVGVAGVEGAGHHELLRVLAGRHLPTSGKVRIPAAVGFVPEDRHSEAVLLDASLVENVALHDAGARRGRMPWPSLRAFTRRLIERFRIQAHSEASRLHELSGGNQQKLVLARELEGSGTPPPGIVLDNPTRGLDVRATREVHARLRSARDAGRAVVLYSSDLDEILALADRVVAVHAGGAREVPLDRAAVGRAMVGG